MKASESTMRCAYCFGTRAGRVVLGQWPVTSGVVIRGILAMTRSGLGLFQAVFQPSIVKGPRGGVSARAPPNMTAVVPVRTLRRVVCALVLMFFSSLGCLV